MKIITVSGPPSSGKTMVILRCIEDLQASGKRAGVIKLDCLSTLDYDLYQERKIPVQVGLSGTLCPDHFFVSNIEEGLRWGERTGLDFLITESAGLCNRCSPHIQGVLAVCVIDNLAGIDTPRKIGPMLKLADVVVITKGDVVSQVEREVFAFRTRQANPGGIIIHINGITGQGATELSRLLGNASDFSTLTGKELRSSMPSALCSYCFGETKIGDEFQLGSVKKMEYSWE